MATIEERTTDDGVTTYRVKVRLKGYPAQTASFSRRTDAKRWAVQTESAIREGRHFKTAEAKRHTLADLVDRYIKTEIPKKGSQAANQTAQLMWWRSAIGPYLLADVTPALIAEQRDRLLGEATHQSAKRSPSTVNRYLAALGHAMTVAVREWGWLDDSPMRKVAKPKEPRGRVRFLSDDERRRLFDACRASREAMLYPVVLLAISTGMRQAEIMNLYWREPKAPPTNTAWGVVDLDRGRVVLHQTKNDERRVVPVSGSAAEELRTLAKVRRLDTDLLFPGKDPARPADMREAFTNALGRAGIENFVFHDCRHTTASYLAMNGATLAEIAEILGHKTLSMVKRYAHLSESHVSGVLERMNAQVIG